MGFLSKLRGDVLSAGELEIARSPEAVVFVERVRCTMSLDAYTAPGRRHDGKRTPTVGGILVTPNRVILWAGGLRHLDAPRSEVTSENLAVAVDGDRLTLTFRAEDFGGVASGRVSLAYRLPDPEQVASALRG